MFAGTGHGPWSLLTFSFYLSQSTYVPLPVFIASPLPQDLAAFSSVPIPPYLPIATRSVAPESCYKAFLISLCFYGLHYITGPCTNRRGEPLLFTCMAWSITLIATTSSVSEAWSNHRARPSRPPPQESSGSFIGEPN